MCGIVGFVSMEDENAGRLLLDGLRKVEYRGYDSAGMAIQSGPCLLVEKVVGKLDVFEKAIDVDEIFGSCGISHTRWATHGGVTRQNAHPHLSCDGKIAIVHNGIIENYQELKIELASKKHKFISETDTEVIVHLIEEKMKAGQGFREAFHSALKMLQGSYGILAISSAEKDLVLAAKNESPLILGKGNGKMFAASDPVPLLKHTNEVIYLDDGEYAMITGKSYQVYDIATGKAKEKQVSKIGWSVQSSDKGMFDHYMLKEIFEQPAAMKKSLEQPYGAVEEFAKAIRTANGVILIGCGTALHAAMAGQYLFDKIAGKHVNVINASEFPYLRTSVDRGSLVIAISQSGETADVLNAMRAIKLKGIAVYSIVNAVGSSIARLSDKTIYINVGPEIAVASTKAFVGQLTVLYQIAYALSGNLAQGRKKLSEITALSKACLDMNAERARKLAQNLLGKEHVYFIGRGANYPLALEGALKMKEISYIHAEGMAAGELKHGTLALIEKGTPIITLNPRDDMFDATLSNAMETKARGARIIAISNAKNEIYDELLQIPEAEGIFYPLLLAIPMQLLAYHLAVLRGHDPDKPRNLAKSVTV
ncbi:MAG: glutamine--fructose-6-phosphate transaminase (isomerizing), partial [Candidatus Micrarchaeota archaeon]